MSYRIVQRHPTPRDAASHIVQSHPNPRDAASRIVQRHPNSRDAPRERFVCMAVGYEEPPKRKDGHRAPRPFWHGRERWQLGPGPPGPRRAVAIYVERPTQGLCTTRGGALLVCLLGMGEGPSGFVVGLGTELYARRALHNALTDVGGYPRRYARNIAAITCERAALATLGARWLYSATGTFTSLFIALHHCGSGRRG